jgi:TolA-binding protein
VACAGGCTWDQLSPFKPPPTPPGPVDSLVLRPDRLEEVKPAAATNSAELDGAKELFRQKEYEKAERVFHRIAEKTKDNAALAEEARFWEAESLYLQQRYPKAADTYIRMLTDFGSGTHRQQAVQRLFDISNYWLEDTRTEMVQAKEQREGKRWVVWPHFVQWDKTKPVLDEEGRAVEVLEQVRYNDIDGPLADKALFLLGSVEFFNQNYRDADYHFTQLVEQHPNSPFAPQATEMAIASKNLCTGGSDYDGRKCAEARDLVHKAQMNYPVLAQDPAKAKLMQDELIGINLQQAERDYKTAEFYRHTGRPCPAYFMYEVVRRRYPGTKYADLATEQMYKLRAKVEKENGGKLPVPEAGPVAPDGVPLQPGMPLDRGAGVPPPGQQPRPLPPNMQGS